MKRVDCLKILAPLIRDELVVVTLGVTKHEWEMINPRDGNCYLSGMGGTTPFGLGLALALPHRKVIVLDSDGSFLFGLNALATLAIQKPPNLSVFVFDNECYESVGGSPSQTAHGVDLAAMARGAGIANAATVTDLEQFQDAARRGLDEHGVRFTVVKIEPWIVDVPTRYYHLLEERNRFARYVEQTENISVLRASKIPRRDPAKWSPKA
jgi:thiamine pyrophosphate-dependent acetolactate synthase large subunit-like protein